MMLSKFKLIRPKRKRNQYSPKTSELVSFQTNNHVSTTGDWQDTSLGLTSREMESEYPSSVTSAAGPPGAGDELNSYKIKLKLANSRVRELEQMLKVLQAKLEMPEYTLESSIGNPGLTKSSDNSGSAGSAESGSDEISQP